MRIYLFFALLALTVFISIKWELMDPHTHRWKTSDETNQIGFALFSFVFIAGCVVLLW